MGDRRLQVIELDLPKIEIERLYDIYKGFKCDNTKPGNHVLMMTAYRKILDQEFKYPAQGRYIGDIESEEMRQKYTPTSALKKAH
jgi:hypothetical protein